MNLHLSQQVQSDRSGDSRPTLQTRGLAVAGLLSGAWREAAATGSPPADAGGSDISRFSEAELTEITPLLCRSGAGALGWWQLRGTPLENCASALELREVYRRHRLSALLHEREVAAVFSLLRAAGIEPVLVKGWAIARRYPDRALRPYGDIDLCVRPDQFPRAAQALERIASLDGPFVDLHSGFARIGQTKTVQSPKSKVQSLSALRRLEHWDLGLGTKSEDDWDDLFARSRVVECGGEPVRILCDEDHLRLLCQHLLRSGAHRPPWLCDIALLLEQNSDFDWDICLGRNTLDANWVSVAVHLAHKLLGANIGNTPFVDQQLPSWLVPAVLDQWGGKRSGQWAVGSGQKAPGRRQKAEGDSDRVAVTDSSRGLSAQRDTPGSSRRNVPDPEGVTQSVPEPLGSLRELYRRWDNPIRSTAAVGGRFDERSRLPYRLLELVARTPEVPDQLRSLWRQIRGQRSEISDQRKEVRNHLRAWSG